MIINLTPHPVRLRRVDGSELTLSACGEPARVSTIPVVGCVIEGMKTFKNIYGPITNLPDPEPGVVYLVSRVVAQAVGSRRADLYVPSDLYRDQYGMIVGAAALEVF